MSDLTTTFTNIANAIRSKTGSSDTMTPSEMPNEIAGIETPMDSINITQNGTYEPSAGRGYNQVIVEVPAPTLITKTITENGTYTASEDNADGYSQVTVAVEGFKKKSIANTPTDIASFNDGTANPMSSLEISIVPVQSGSGDPSPQNVRPISGWSGANVARRGKNLLTFPYYTTSGTISGVSVTVNPDGRVIANGTSDAGNNIYYQYNNYKLKKGTYTISVIGKHVGAAIRIYDRNTSTVIATLWSSAENTKETFTLTDDITNGMVYANWSSNGTVIDFDCTVQIEKGNEATTHSPYQGSTLSIPFHDNSDNPITVYGGTLNVTSGELRVDRVKRALSANDTFVKLGDITVYLDTWLDIVKPTSPELGLMDCSHYKEVLQSSATDSCIAKPINNRAIIFYDSVHATSANDFKAYVTEQINNNTPIEIVYKLATPQTYQLTPAQVSTLLGQNNIFANCGQILEGEYFVTL